MKLLYLTSALASLGFLLCIQLLSKTRKSELLLPWYDVTSTGDGISPEVVPPKMVVPSNLIQVVPAAAGPVRQSETKWNGDHVLNGGNKEWAEEDSALHALNMANWRIKILQTQLRKQKLQYTLMNSQDCQDSPCGHKKHSKLSQIDSDSGVPSEVQNLERTVAKQAKEIKALEQRVVRDHRGRGRDHSRRDRGGRDRGGRDRDRDQDRSGRDGGDDSD